MIRTHPMGFGAEVREDGRIRFRLWAPAVRDLRVSIARPAGRLEIPMERLAGGWHEVTTSDAAPGDLYRYRLDSGMLVPDPASRFQPHDVLADSEVVDPRAYEWRDDAWSGRKWTEMVFYEIHVGAFTTEGTFSGAAGKLDSLVDLGVTAIELMPIGDFPGARNWGYDGAFPFAPDSRYGRPEDLKSFVEAAHARGISVILDVVYNHFGPEGTFLAEYAPEFFTDRHRTPWGSAINYDGAGSRVVRDFVIDNALYWLEEYAMDGLRLDAVHEIKDDSRPDVIEEIASRVRAGPGDERRIHLILENDDNAARYLRPAGDRRTPHYDAQWNDDIHHVIHVLTTGESDGYYIDYSEGTIDLLARSLCQGFAYQGEAGRYSGHARGEPTEGIPPTSFISFLQNHDQIGNRAMGERLAHYSSPAALRAATALILLAPSPPLLFMGEEWAADQPFPFFCDFGGDLARAVTEGRRREFERFPAFRDPEARLRIPDPNDPGTFRSAVLDWSARRNAPHREWLDLYSSLLRIRRDELAPRLRGMPAGMAAAERLGERALHVRWKLGDGSTLNLVANLGPAPARLDRAPLSPGRILATVSDTPAEGARDGKKIPPWTVTWSISEEGGR